MTQTNQLLNRIKETLGKNPRGMSITEISKEINLNRNSVAKYVNMLLVSGQVEMRTQAAAKIFYLTQRIPLSNLLSISNEGVLVVDQALKATQVNDNICYQLGIKREAIENRYILDVTDLPLDTSRMLMHLKSALNGKKIRDEDSVMKGEVCRHFRVQYVPTTFEGGELAVAVVLTDITDQKGLTKRLEETEERYRILAESAQDIIFLASPEGKILYMNAYGADILKKDPAALQGRYITDIFPSNDVKHWMEEILQVAQTSTPIFREARHILAGTEYWFEHRLIPITGDNAVPYIMGLSRDITLRKRNEKELEQYREHLEHLVTERTAKLQRSEERLRMALEGANDGLWDWNIQTGELYLSLRCYSLLGCESGEIPISNGKWKSLVHPDDLDAVLQRVDDILSGTTTHLESEQRMRSKSGDYRWIFSRGRVTSTDEEGRPLRVVGTLTDITDRKQMEEALRHSETRLRTIVENLNEGLVVADLDGNLLHWNSAALEMYEVPDLGVTLNNQSDFGIIFELTTMDGAVLPEEQWPLSRILRGEEIRDMEVRIRRVGSSWERIFNHSGTLVRDADGNPLMAVVTFTDSTEHKRVEEALRQAERDTALILNSTAEMFAYYDKDLRVLWVNRAAAAFIDREPEDLVGHVCYEIWHNRTSVCDGCPVIRAKGTKKPHEAEITTPDGRAFFLRGYPVIDEKRDLIGLIEFAQDVTEQKQAEEALEAASAYNRSLIEANLDPLVTIGPDGRITDVNAATEDVTGYPRDVLIGTYFSDYFTDPAMARAGYQQVFTDGQVRDYPLEIRHRDGAVTPVLYNATVYRDKQGTVTGVFAAARDITERRRAEEELTRLNRQLEESREQYRCLVEHAPDVIALHDGDRYLYINPAGVRLFRAESPDDIIGKSIMTFLHPDFRNMVKTRNDQLRNMASDVPQVEEKLVALDGTIIDVDVTAHLFETQGKRLIQVIARDITERKKAEEALRKSEERFRHIAEHSIDIIYVLNREGRITYASPSIERITGYTQEEAAKMYFFDLLPEADIPKRYRTLRQLIEGEELLHQVVNIVTKSGKTVTVDCTEVPVREDGTIVGVQGIARDIAQKESF
jgi:PAS domain S-box-containing protein